MTPRRSEYGTAHQLRRKNFQPLVESGQMTCGYCGGRIWPGQDWHLGHSVDRSQVWPEHASCNCKTSTRRLRHSREW